MITLVHPNVLKPVTLPLVLFDHDACCGKKIIKASRDGELEGRDEWICPTCGSPWKPKQLAEGLVFWAPILLIAIF